MTDSMGPEKLVHHMQNTLYTYDEYLICIRLGPSILSVICKNLSYTYDEYLICIRLGPSISSVICKNPSYSGPSYPSSPVYEKLFDKESLNPTGTIIISQIFSKLLHCNEDISICFIHELSCVNR